MIPMPLLKKQIDAHPCPLVFATISGAHLYGFPSPDSDFDLRGVHLLPLHEVVGLRTGREVGRIQSGYLYHYAFVMLLGVAGFLSYALWAWNH